MNNEYKVCTVTQMVQNTPTIRLSQTHSLHECCHFNPNIMTLISLQLYFFINMSFTNLGKSFSFSYHNMKDFTKDPQ